MKKYFDKRSKDLDQQQVEILLRGKRVELEVARQDFINQGNEKPLTDTYYDAFEKLQDTGRQMRSIVSTESQ